MKLISISRPLELLILLEHAVSPRSFFHHPHLKSYGTFSQWAPIAYQPFSHTLPHYPIYFLFYVFHYYISSSHGFPVAQQSRIHLPKQETQDTRVWSLGWEGPLEEEMATHSNILAGRIPWREEPLGYSPQGHKELNTSEHLRPAHHCIILLT